jgi:predicted RecB family nuclease
VIYAHVYFPTTSNGLKEIAGYCGFHWTETLISGLQSIAWREMWETSGDVSKQKELIHYNSEDCEALDVVVQAIFGRMQSIVG